MITSSTAVLTPLALYNHRRLLKTTSATCVPKPQSAFLNYGIFLRLVNLPVNKPHCIWDEAYDNILPMKLFLDI